jgi:hypothetical protein
MTARIQVGRRSTTWSLKFRDDDERAAAIMKPVLVAWADVYQAAKQELNWGIGTAEHTAAVAARVEACGRLAKNIYAVGGPKELVAFVMMPQDIGKKSLLPAVVSRKPIKEMRLKDCEDWLVREIREHPVHPRVPIPELRKEAKGKFNVPFGRYRDSLEGGDREAGGDRAGPPLLNGLGPTARLVI